MNEYHHLIAIEWGPTRAEREAAGYYGVPPGWHATGPESEVIALNRSDLKLVVEVGEQVCKVQLWRQWEVFPFISLDVRNEQLISLPRLVWAD